MFWKLFIILFRRRKKNYLRAVKIGEDVFTIDIHKYTPMYEELKKWENALGNPKAQS